MNQGTILLLFYNFTKKVKIQEDSKSILEQQRFYCLDRSIDKDCTIKCKNIAFAGYEIFHILVLSV